MAGNKRHAGGVASAMANLKKIEARYSAVNSLTWDVGSEFDTAEHPISTRIIPVHDGHGRAIAAVYAGFGDGDAVAAVITAAPAMLVALRELRAFVARAIPAAKEPALVEYLARADDAISKAENAQ